MSLKRSAPSASYTGMKTKRVTRKCSTCGGRLQFVASEQDQDTTYVCTRCGDEWFGSTLGLNDPPLAQRPHSGAPTDPPNDETLRQEGSVES